MRRYLNWLQNNVTQSIFIQKFEWTFLSIVECRLSSYNRIMLWYKTRNIMVKSMLSQGWQTTSGKAVLHVIGLCLTIYYMWQHTYKIVYWKAQSHAAHVSADSRRLRTLHMCIDRRLAGQLGDIFRGWCGTKSSSAAPGLLRPPPGKTAP